MPKQKQTLASFEKDIGRAARTFVKTGADHRGADYDDYANEMRVAAWRAIQKLQDRGYVIQAIWNAGRSLRRRSSFEAAFKRRLLAVEHVEPSIDPNLDWMVDAHRAWVQTPDSDRELVLDHKLGGRPFKAIAKDLGVSDWEARRRFNATVAPMRHAFT